MFGVKHWIPKEIYKVLYCIVHSIYIYIIKFLNKLKKKKFINKMKLKLDRSVYPLFFFVGSSLTMGTTFGFYNLFFRPEVKLLKKNRMEIFRKPIN
tara:strand:+ start:1858 stop:2145 length:288 start_codon:yes stop_codon:yes gene_type:complete